MGLGFLRFWVWVGVEVWVGVGVGVGVGVRVGARVGVKVGVRGGVQRVEIGRDAVVDADVRARARVLAEGARCGDVDDAGDELGHLEDVRPVSMVGR